MVTEVTLKLTTPVPELLALKVPENVAAKLSEPAVGTVWLMVSVKVPEALITPSPETNVWKLPKLEPVGVFNEVDPRPVKVIIKALPLPPRKVTELVPLPAHPPQVNVPEVEKVTGSALAAETVNIMTPATAINMKSFLIIFFIPFVSEEPLPLQSHTQFPRACEGVQC